jgi:hypothetical protein
VLSFEERLMGAFLFLNELKYRVTVCLVCLPEHFRKNSLYQDRLQQGKDKTYKLHFV